MPVVINEFEVAVPPPPAPAAQSETAPQQQPPAPSAQEIERIARRQEERCARVRAH